MASLFPAALDTNDSLYVAVNGLKSTLTSGINSSAATIFLAVPVGVPATGYVTIKGEAIHYTGKTTVSLTGCTRGQDGTAQAAHFQNDEVDFGPVADHHNVLVQAIEAIQAKIGAGASGIDGAQMKAASIPKSKLAAGVGFAPLFLRVHLAANQADTGSNAVVNFDTVDQDDGANWNVGGKRWIAPAIGTVIAMWRVCSLQGPASNDCTGSLAKNGTVFRRGNEAASPSINQNGSVGQCIVRVAATDYLQIQRDYRSTATPILGDAAASTTFDLMFIAD